MGRKKIQIKLIEDERIKRVTFKKRRIGLLKKAIQLSMLTEAKVMLKVYNSKDKSLIEYYSHSENDFDNLSKNSPQVYEYSQFHNKHYDLVAQIEENVNKSDKSTDKKDQQDIDLAQLFSLAKKNLTEDIDARSLDNPNSDYIKPKSTLKRAKYDDLSQNFDDGGSLFHSSNNFKLDSSTDDTQKSLLGNNVPSLNAYEVQRLNLLDQSQKLKIQELKMQELQQSIKNKIELLKQVNIQSKDLKQENHSFLEKEQSSLNLLNMDQGNLQSNIITIQPSQIQTIIKPKPIYQQPNSFFIIDNNMKLVEQKPVIINNIIPQNHFQKPILINIDQSQLQQLESDQSQNLDLRTLQQYQNQQYLQIIPQGVFQNPNYQNFMLLK